MLEEEIKKEDLEKDPSVEETKEAEEISEEIVEEEIKEESKEESDVKKENPLKKKVDELEDRYRRLYAEFDNFRKRSEKEKSGMFDMGAKTVIEKILPVVDNFERALENVSEEEKENPFVDGVEKIYKQMISTFEDMDVKPIKTVGEKFDPNLHNAVMTDTESDEEEDIITADFQKGYTYKDQVVRHSMVKVKK